MTSTEVETDAYLRHIQQRLAQNEATLRLIALDLATHESRVALVGSVPWTKLVKDLQDVVNDETEKLLVTQMDQYTLGCRQGLIRALRLLARTEPLDMQHIAELRETATILQGKIQEDRQLLT